MPYWRVRASLRGRESLGGSRANERGKATFLAAVSHRRDAGEASALVSLVRVAGSKVQQRKFERRTRARTCLSCAHVGRRESQRASGQKLHPIASCHIGGSLREIRQRSKVANAGPESGLRKATLSLSLTKRRPGNEGQPTARSKGQTHTDSKQARPTMAGAVAPNSIGG